MPRHRLHIVAAAFSALVMTAAPALGNSSSPTLTVRLYDGVGVEPDKIVTARFVAEPILAETGIDVSFRYCRMAAAAAYDACAESLSPNEVVVRMIDAPEGVPGTSPLALGYSYVVRNTGRGWLATVYVDRIKAAAWRVGIDGARLLGMVVAHEVGHLLLGQSHSEEGLMAPQWHDLTLRRNTATAFHFTPYQAAEIQERVLDR